jgi:hypothetical protein
MLGGSADWLARAASAAPVAVDDLNDDPDNDRDE